MPTRNSDEVTLLLVEDDDIDAISIVRGFAKQRIGNEIVRACDGIEALEKLESQQVKRPLVVLLDLQMPRMNGLEFLQTVRQDEKWKDIVVFVLTTSKDEQDIFESYKLNVAGYFVKDDAGQNFIDIIDLIDGYWKVAHLPT